MKIESNFHNKDIFFLNIYYFVKINRIGGINFKVSIENKLFLSNKCLLYNHILGNVIQIKHEQIQNKVDFLNFLTPYILI